MLSHRKASFYDVRMILSDLSEVTKSEIAAVFANSGAASINGLAHVLFLSGPSEISFSDDVPLFIVGHYPMGIGLRGTWCFAGKATETLRRETFAAATRQVNRMRTAHPLDRFTSVSYSQHPKRDWFFAAMGFRKRADFGGEAVFDLLPEEAPPGAAAPPGRSGPSGRGNRGPCSPA